MNETGSTGHTASGVLKRAVQSVANATHPGKCPACDKHGLPILLTLPTLVDNNYAASVHPTTQPLLKDVPALTHAGYAMRTLREGYVMAYYETPPASLPHENGWTIAKVHNGGYMTPTSFAALGLADGNESAHAAMFRENDSFGCNRVGGYASALLFVIPQPQKAGKVWVAFSSHAWSPKVRADYASGVENRQRFMTMIDARNVTCTQSQPFTESTIRQAVIDYNPDFDLDSFKGNPYPLGGMRQFAFNIGSLIEWEYQFDQRHEAPINLIAQAKVAQGKPFPEGTTSESEALIVGLADPEGVTTCAAYRRSHVASSTANWLKNIRDEHQEVIGPRLYQSAAMIDGLFQGWNHHVKTAGNADDTYLQSQRHLTKGIFSLPADGRAFETLYLRKIHETDEEATRKAKFIFHKMKKNGRLPEGAFYQGYTDGVIGRDTRYKLAVIPSQAEMRAKVTERITKVQEKLTQQRRVKTPTGASKKVDWDGFLALHEQFKQQDQAQLALAEQDHKVWLQSQQLNAFFNQCFSIHSPRDGIAYAQAVDACLQGGPMTAKALGLEENKDGGWWLSLLTPNPTDEGNYLLRAILGNTQLGFDWFKNAATPSDHAELADTLLALAPIKQLSPVSAQALMASLLGMVAAVATAQDANHSLNTDLRSKLKALAQNQIVQSAAWETRNAAKALHLYKLRVPLDVASRLWRHMTNANYYSLPNHFQVDDTRGRSIHWNAFDGVELAAAVAASSAKDQRVDVFLFSDEAFKENALRPYGNEPTYAIEQIDDGGLYDEPLEGNTNIPKSEAERLAKRSGRLMQLNAPILLNSAVGLLQLLTLRDNWNQFINSSGEAQRAAAMTLTSTGMGVVSAGLQISDDLINGAAKEAADKAGRNMVTKLGRLAGWFAAIGAGVAMVQSISQSIEALSRDDYNIAGLRAVQGLMWAGVAYTSLAAVGVVSSFGLSALAMTGIGFMLVLAIALIGWLIWHFKDTPLQAWAARTLWGEDAATDYFKSATHAHNALTEALIGVEASFTYHPPRSTISSRAELELGQAETTLANAVFTLALPSVLLSRLRWSMSIRYGRGGSIGEPLATWQSDEGAVAYNPDSRGFKDDGHFTHMTLRYEKPDDIRSSRLSGRFSLAIADYGKGDDDNAYRSLLQASVYN